MAHYGAHLHDTFISIVVPAVKATHMIDCSKHHIFQIVLLKDKNTYQRKAFVSLILSEDQTLST